jgi:histone H3-like centromeric protein A
MSSTHTIEEGHTVLHAHAAEVKPEAVEETVEAVATPAEMKTALAARKKRRFRPGTRALMDIRKQQRDTGTIFPKAVIARVVREICNAEHPDGTIRWTKRSLEAVHVAVEAMLLEHVRAGHVIALRNGRKSLSANDMRCAREVHAQLSGTSC